MIVAELKGGLGNQMFQYAAGRSLAAARGVELLLSTHGLSTGLRRGASRPYELGDYRVVSRLCSADQEREVTNALLLRKLSRFLTPWAVYNESGIGFDSRLSAVPNDSILRGYWQSPRYFESFSRTIADELTPINTMPADHQIWYERIAQEPSVSVHVRRGDYVTNPAASKFHGVLPVEYYARAVEFIREIEPSLICYVFTDDPVWCREHLRLQGCEVRHPSAKLVSTGIQDLTLMRQCRHHIIANSSFSWWAAWLAGVDSPGLGTVVAPRKWFSDAANQDNISDRFPPHWTLL